MPRLRNTRSGAVVSVTDETADRLGSEWEPVKRASTTKKTAPKAEQPPEDETEAEGSTDSDDES